MTFPLTLNNGQNFAAGGLTPDFECFAERKVKEKVKKYTVNKVNSGKEYWRKICHED